MFCRVCGVEMRDLGPSTTRAGMNSYLCESCLRPDLKFRSRGYAINEIPEAEVARYPNWYLAELAKELTKKDRANAKRLEKWNQKRDQRHGGPGKLHFGND